jgi:YVTN family beta-propeller protein
MSHLQGGRIMMAMLRLFQWFLIAPPSGYARLTSLHLGRPGAVQRSGWSRRLLLMLMLLTMYTPLAQPVEAAAAPKVYIGLFKDNAIAVLDSSTNRVQGTVPVPQGPHGLAITPDGRKVYVSSDGASTVSVIDTQTDQVVGSVEVGANPHGLAMSPDGRQVLVGGFGTNQVLLIDTTTDQVVGRTLYPCHITAC